MSGDSPTGGTVGGRDQEAGAARAALLDLLERYDLANRLAIDTVYAQLSPTLDDFYAESLRLVFPAGPDAAGDLRPEIVLTRTVPGHEPKAVRGQGAPFPLGRAEALVAAALGREALPVRPRQVGGSQVVALYREPDGVPVDDLLRSGEWDPLTAPPSDARVLGVVWPCLSRQAVPVKEWHGVCCERALEPAAADRPDGTGVANG